MVIYRIRMAIKRVFCKHKASPFVALNAIDERICEKCGKPMTAGRRQ